MPDRDVSESATGSHERGTANLAPMTSEATSRDDWAAQIAERVGKAVEVVRDQTVGRVEKIVGAAIFGVLAFSVAVFILVILVTGLVRLLDNEVFNQRVWASDFLIGGIFVVAGTFISTMRHRRG